MHKMSYAFHTDGGASLRGKIEKFDVGMSVLQGVLPSSEEGGGWLVNLWDCQQANM